jgi:hypothetical protein
MGRGGSPNPRGRRDPPLIPHTHARRWRARVARLLGLEHNPAVGCALCDLLLITGGSWVNADLLYMWVPLPVPLVGSCSGCPRCKSPSRVASPHRLPLLWTSVRHFAMAMGCSTLLLLISGAATAPTWEHLDASYTFEHFVVDFQLKRQHTKGASLTRRLQMRSPTTPTVNSCGRRRSISFQTCPRPSFATATAGYPGGRCARSSSPTRKADFLDSEAHLDTPHDFKLSDLPTHVDWRTKGVVTPI